MRGRPHRAVSRSGSRVNHVRNRIPFAAKLADLLRIHIQGKRHLVSVFGALRLHRRQIEPTARRRVQNAHQRPLRIAIANLKSLHELSPLSRSAPPALTRYCAGSSSSIISDKAAPAGTIGKTLASGAQSNTNNSGSVERRNRSIWSPVSLDTGYSRTAS